MRHLSVLLALCVINPAMAATQGEDCPATTSATECVLASLESASAQGNPAAKVELAQELLKSKSPGDVDRAVRLLSGVAGRGDAWATILLANLYRQGEVVQQDGAKVVALLEPLAEAKNAGALTGLGELYLAGARNVPKDVPLAASYFEKAALTGDAWGQFKLASLLVDGEGVTHNIPRAVSLLEEVSKGGDPWVLKTLGDLYAKGLAEPAEEAIAYFEKAAATGNTAAMARLAQAFDTGLGTVKADPSKSREYWEAAVAKGDSFASINLARLLLDDGDKASVDRAVGLLDAGAARGEAWPTTILADLLVRGEKVPQDAKKAVSLLTPLAEDGVAAAQVALSDILAKGAAGVPADLPRAYALVEAAYAQGETQAVSRLGFMLVRGEGTTKDVPRGLEVLRTAVSDSTDPWLAIDVGSLFADGKAVPVDGKEAIAMYERAADLGNAAGLFRLGISYRDGVGAIEPNVVLAQDYFGRAADMGDNASRVTLAQMLLKSDVRADVDQGVSLLEAAAGDRDVWGTTSLAALLLEGRVLPVDGARAQALLEPLAKNGNGAALAMLGDLYAKGASPIEAQPDTARGYYEQAVAKDDLGAKNKLGLMLLAGTGGEADPERGLKLLREVADKGDGWSKIQLGEVLSSGEYVPLDEQGALKAFNAARDAGLPAADIKLGYLYLTGKGAIGADPAAAARYFTEAADAGDSVGKISLALLLLEGKGVGQDVDKAVSLLEEAAAEGSAWANGALGGVFADGRHLTPDFKVAQQFSVAAQEAGDSGAMQRFGMLLATGPLAAEHRKEGVALVEAAVSENLPNAVVDRARLKMMGLIGKDGGAAAERDLLAEVEDGNSSALRALLQLYRSGGPGLKASPTRGEAMLEKHAAILSTDARAYETLALRAMRPATERNLAEMGKVLPEIARADFSQTLQMLFWGNKNAYVYVIQKELQALGLYSGRSDGLLTRPTIAAINRLCAQLDAKDVCAAGPLTPSVAVFLSNYLASPTQSATAPDASGSVTQG